MGDVGYEGKCQVIYDIGASILSSNIEIRNYVNKSTAFDYNPSLIISHCDVDHYQSLFEVDKKTLGKFCCLFVPSKLISETSKRAYKLLEENFNYIHTINESPNRAIKRRISLEVLDYDKHYAFFRGERSSDINKSGLTVAVWNNRSCAILAGDHQYSQIFQDMYHAVPKDVLANIVTPHHGGQAGKIVKDWVQMD